MARRLLDPIAWVLACGLAQAQLAPIAPFVGGESEDFESQSQQSSVTCIQERVFQQRADLCTAFGSGCWIFGGSMPPASITPRSGTQLFHADTLVRLTFDRPVQRFGAWFASDWVNIGAVGFYDETGQSFASDWFQMTPCTSGCAWVWNGWDAGSGPRISAIQFDTATATGGHFQLEDLELDFACGFASVYCTAKVNSQGCTPTISASGSASASAGGGFTLDAAAVLNQKSGLLVYGKSGPAAVTFHGGLLCMAPPRSRTPVQSSGGSVSGNDCSGHYSFDFNAWIATGVDPALLTGTRVNAQYWSRDPGFAAPHNVGLSAAVEFDLCP